MAISPDDSLWSSRILGKTFQLHVPHFTYFIIMEKKVLIFPFRISGKRGMYSFLFFTKQFLQKKAFLLPVKLKLPLGLSKEVLFAILEFGCRWKKRAKQRMLQALSKPTATKCVAVWAFFVFFGDFSVVFDFAGNFLLNLTDSGQPKVVRRKLRIELFKRRTWHHVRWRHCIYNQLISTSNYKGKPLKSNKSPFSSLTEIVKL